MYNCSKYFSALQEEVIESNVERFVQRIDNDVKQLNELQYFVAKAYINRFKVKPIDPSREIVGVNKLQVNFFFNILSYIRIQIISKDKILLDSKGY